ncbi:MAG: hypothetical protein QM811_18885 [Pirellulales bacterium]
MKPVLEKPLAGLTHVDIAGIIGKLNPWVDYGFGIAMNEVDGNQRFMLATAQTDIKTVLRVFSCFKAFSAYTYAEDKALVTHTLTTIEDLEVNAIVRCTELDAPGTRCDPGAFFALNAIPLKTIPSSPK